MHMVMLLCLVYVYKTIELRRMSFHLTVQSVVGVRARHGEGAPVPAREAADCQGQVQEPRHRKWKEKEI